MGFWRRTCQESVGKKLNAFVEHAIPLRRLGGAKEVADLLLFLLERCELHLGIYIDGGQRV
jgi:hypothetical protein